MKLKNNDLSPGKNFGNNKESFQSHIEVTLMERNDQLTEDVFFF